MKSLGVNRASAERQKSGLSDRKFWGPQRRLVKLHRPPPDIKIFFPGASERSRTATRAPNRPASAAHRSPAAPPPNTTASNLSFGTKVCPVFAICEDNCTQVACIGFG